MVAVKHLTLSTLLLAIAGYSTATPLVPPSAKEIRAHPFKGIVLKEAGLELESAPQVPKLHPHVVPNGQQQRDLEAVEENLVARAPRTHQNKNKSRKNQNKVKGNRNHRSATRIIESRDIDEEEGLEVRDIEAVDSYLAARTITDVNSLIANAHERDLEEVRAYLVARELERRGIMGKAFKAVKAIGGGAKKLGRYVDWAKLGADAGKKLNKKLKSREIGNMQARDIEELIERSVNDALRDALVAQL